MEGGVVEREEAVIMKENAVKDAEGLLCIPCPFLRCCGGGSVVD
jgi:hypothetical protein